MTDHPPPDPSTATEPDPSLAAYIATQHHRSGHSPIHVGDVLAVLVHLQDAGVDLTPALPDPATRYVYDARDNIHTVYDTWDAYGRPAAQLDGDHMDDAASAAQWIAARLNGQDTPDD